MGSVFIALIAVTLLPRFLRAGIYTMPEFSPGEHSELSYFRGLSLVELGRSDDAKALFQSLHAFAEKELESEAKIDYFATSLPLLVVFEDDLDEVKNRRTARLLKLAKKGLSRQEAMR
jgi:hypothetical protein